MNKSRKLTYPAFTLIELLVVIGIIAILVGVAAPGLTSSMLSGRIAQATAHARQVALALRMYAQDNEGAFPENANFQSSNEAFRELFPEYLETEAIFAVASSPVGKKADNAIEPRERILAHGENHWAYVQGLSTTSNSSWPLVVDHSDGSGYYRSDPSQPGGTWRGTKSILVRCDTSAAALKLHGTASKRYLPRHNDDRKNALSVRDYMGDGAKLLEPLK